MKTTAILFYCLLLSAGAFAQNSVGMTIGTFYNWGQPFSWKDAAAYYPQNTAADSAMKAPYQTGSVAAHTSFTVGINFRVKPTDSTRFMHKWSRNYALSIGSIELKEIAAGDLYTYDVNTPYTTIYQGDTNVYLLDSIKYYRYGLTDRGAFAQVGFGMMRELKTETRIKGEIGFQLSAGLGKTTSYYSCSAEFSERDTLANFYSPNVRSLYYDQVNIGTQTVVTANVSIMGGIIIPLAKGDDSWWLSLHGALGIGTMYAYDKWVASMSFVPTLGVNYRLREKTEADGYR